MNSRTKAHLTGYFLTYRCVYLLDTACKGCSLQFFKFVVLFSRIMFLKLDLFYFVLVAEAYGFCLRARAVNSDHILNVLETVKFVCSIQNFSFIVHSARACICKQNIHNSL